MFNGMPGDTVLRALAPDWVATWCCACSSAYKLWGRSVQQGSRALEAAAVRVFATPQWLQSKVIRVGAPQCFSAFSKGGFGGVWKSSFSQQGCLLHEGNGLVWLSWVGVTLSFLHCAFLGPSWLAGLLCHRPLRTCLEF